MSALTATERYRYLSQRSNGVPVHYALVIARGSVAFDQLDMDNECNYVLERDGMTFTIRIEFDHDAFHEYRETEQDADGNPYPQWSYVIEVNGEYVDSMGGIGGGYFDARNGAEMDDQTKAYMWSEFIDQACDPARVRA